MVSIYLTRPHPAHLYMAPPVKHTKLYGLWNIQYNICIEVSICSDGKFGTRDSVWSLVCFLTWVSNRTWGKHWWRLLKKSHTVCPTFNTLIPNTCHPSMCRSMKYIECCWKYTVVHSGWGKREVARSLDKSNNAPESTLTQYLLLEEKSSC